MKSTEQIAFRVTPQIYSLLKTLTEKAGDKLYYRQVVVAGLVLYALTAHNEDEDITKKVLDVYNTERKKQLLDNILKIND